MNMAANYTAVGNKLSDRVLALIPDNPEILTMTSAWDLLKIPGFKCNDLQPSMAQAESALANAKQRRRAREEATS